jgi:hypothetical protein
VAGAFDGYGAGLGFDLGEGVDEFFAAGCDGDGAARADGVRVVAGEVEEAAWLWLWLGWCSLLGLVGCRSGFGGGVGWGVPVGGAGGLWRWSR